MTNDHHSVSNQIKFSDTNMKCELSGKIVRSGTGHNTKFRCLKLIIGLIVLILSITLNEVLAQVLTSDQIFSTDHVLDVQIKVDPNDWSKICSQERIFEELSDLNRKDSPPRNPFTYVEAQVTINDVTFPRVGIRKKGFLGSLSNTRPSLKVKLNHLDKNGQVDGITNLTFNNNQQDTSLMSQIMSYALFNAVGSPAPRCNYARLTVNGQNLGVYSHVERIHKPFLKRVFGNDNGSLYEGTLTDFRPGWLNSFEHKLGSDQIGRQRIQQLIEALNSKDKNIEEAIGQLVDLESFYNFWVMESLLGLWDGYSGNGNNFFFYLNPKTDRFHFIPWGADHGFSRFSGKRKYNHPPPISVKTQGLICHRLYQIEACRRQYERTLRKTMLEYWKEDNLISEIQRLETMIQPYLILDQKRITKTKTFDNKKRKDKYKDFSKKTRISNGKENNPKKDTSTKTEQSIVDFIRYRRESISNEIINGMPLWARPPREYWIKQNQPFESSKDPKIGRKIGHKKEKKNINQQQTKGLAKDWINYFRTASEQQIHQSITSEKFQNLPESVKKEIKIAAQSYLIKKVTNKDNLVKIDQANRGLFTRKLTYDNLDRAYTVYIPSSYEEVSEVPLLLHFHGFGGSAGEGLIFSDMQTLAETEGFILVGPQGASLEEEKSSHWNHEPKSAKQNKSDIDDLGFTSALIDEICSSYSIDSKRVYACGYSNGAFLANSLSCYLSNKIAAVASIAGLISTEIIKQHRPIHPTAVIMFHGTEDQIIPYEGIEGYALSIDQMIDYWIEFNSTDKVPDTNVFTNDSKKIESSAYAKKNSLEYGETKVEHYSYKNGRNQVSVEHYKIIEGNHWPQISYQGSNISRLIWDFVSQYDINGLRQHE